MPGDPYHHRDQVQRDQQATQDNSGKYGLDYCLSPSPCSSCSVIAGTPRQRPRQRPPGSARPGPHGTPVAPSAANVARFRCPIAILPPQISSPATPQTSTPTSPTPGSCSPARSAQAAGRNRAAEPALSSRSACPDLSRPGRRSGTAQVTVESTQRRYHRDPCADWILVTCKPSNVIGDRRPRNRGTEPEPITLRDHHRC